MTRYYHARLEVEFAGGQVREVEVCWCHRGWERLAEGEEPGQLVIISAVVQEPREVLALAGPRLEAVLAALVDHLDEQLAQ